MDVYRGRFAPSPTGPLHLGSLLAALASYLQAHSKQGEWLVRIEDLDTCRTISGAADSILKTLENFHLHWHGPVMWQSHRLDAYHTALEKLKQAQWTYPCICTRKLLEGEHIYPGTCRNSVDSTVLPHALRVKTNDKHITWMDGIQGSCNSQLAEDCGDFIVQRRDGLIAYQLAVVVDDAEQGVSEVVRGTDLLDSTPRQIHLQQLLGLSTPNYCHIPIIVDKRGQKLSKQSLAEPVDTLNTSQTLYQLLDLLNHCPPKELKGASASQLLDWAILHWQPEKLHQILTLSL